MKVRLIGTNIELAPVLSALSGETEEPVLLSPEPIAAAYARISRSEDSVDALRHDARLNVEKARKSNRNIVFDMGHASIAEHAVFNFDIEEVSRLAIEKLEHTRLASYTERSQRYVLIGEDFLVPAELTATGGQADQFRAAVQALFGQYARTYDALLARHLAAEPKPPKRMRRRDLETAAKEDARYLLPLATTGQLGLTINARSLESTVKRLKGSCFEEIRELGRRLETAALEVTPSLIRYTEPTGLEECAESEGEEALTSADAPAPQEVRLAWHTPSGDQVLSGLMSGRGWQVAGHQDSGEKIEDYFNRASPWDRAPRSFEFVDLVFDLTCSASCFAQLKRHRMASFRWGPYDPALGVVVPPSVSAAGLEIRFKETLAQPMALFDELEPAGNPGRYYLLTNAHCRRVLMKMNLRELYHFTRLRMDPHAQWEIRGIAGQMCALAQGAFPEAAGFLGGKHEFSKLKG
jgi:flavin-dependent thymidylate synthase